MFQDRRSTDKMFEEIIRMVSKMDPVLAKIDQYLGDESLFALIKAEVSKRYSKTMEIGRNSIPIEVILRMLAVKRLYGYIYEEAERYFSDSLILRQFCRVYLKACQMTLC